MRAAPLCPEPQRPPGSVLRASPPAPRTLPAPPRTATATATATARMAGWLGDMWAGPGARPHFGASREQRCPMRVGFAEVPCPGAKAGDGVLSSRAERCWVEGRCFRLAPGLGFGWENGFLRDGGRAKRIFCCPHGVWAGLCGVWETCNGPGTRAPCRLVISLFPRSLAPEVPGFVCSNDCPGAVSSRCSAAPPP